MKEFRIVCDACGIYAKTEYRKRAEQKSLRGISYSIEVKEKRSSHVSFPSADKDLCIECYENLVKFHELGILADLSATFEPIDKSSRPEWEEA